MADANYLRAAGYYANHSDANTIRKIQNFLAARGLYEGELDGIFGPKTYEAVRKYQQQNNLDVDGMWGESTNSVHRVLNATNAPYRNDASGSSGAHTSYMRGVNTGVNRPQSPIQTSNDLNKAINQLTEKYYSEGGEDWFWGDNADASQWRQFLMKTKEGQAILNDFFDNANNPGKINPRYLTNEQKQRLMKRKVSSGISNAGYGVLATAGAVGAMLNPAAAAGAAIGGHLAGKAGEQIGRDIYKEGDSYGFTSNGLMGTPSSHVMPAQEHGAQEGRAIGTAVGAAVGGAAGNGAAKGFAPRNWFRSMAKSNYTRPTEIQQPRVAKTEGGKSYYQPREGGKYGESVDAKPGTFIEGRGDGWRFFKQGGKLIPRFNYWNL